MNENSLPAYLFLCLRPTLIPAPHPDLLPLKLWGPALCSDELSSLHTQVWELLSRMMLSCFHFLILSQGIRASAVCRVQPMFWTWFSSWTQAWTMVYGGWAWWEFLITLQACPWKGILTWRLILKARIKPGSPLPSGSPWDSSSAFALLPSSEAKLIRPLDLGLESLNCELSKPSFFPKCLRYLTVAMKKANIAVC